MRIGVFCSGGDAPGMNACLRAVVRTAVNAGHEVIGINHGYQGILDEDFFHGAGPGQTMTSRNVSSIIQHGGTIIFSARSDEFRTPEGQVKAARLLRKHKIDALVAIGGDGTFRGAIALAKVWDGQIIGCPGTIDNDLYGTDYTIGFSTAVATAVDCVDKLRDTAESHQRMFLVEVMGRHSGYLALYTALAAGAEYACVPETPTDVAELVARIRVLRDRGKNSIIIVVAEGDEAGSVVLQAPMMEAAGCPFPVRTVVLGHIQRGGSPSPDDRILATKLGTFATEAVLAGKTGAYAGEVNGCCVLTSFEDAVTKAKHLPPELIALLEKMAT